MIITETIFNQGKSVRGGWNTEQIKALGVTTFYKGWRRELVGKDIPEENIKRFLELKDVHLKGKQSYRNKIGALDFVFCPSGLPYSEQYKHPNWQKMRLYVFKRDNYTCVNCRFKDKTLHAHHLKYIKGKFVWEVPHWYIVTLCEDCHSQEHGRDLTIKK